MDLAQWLRSLTQEANLEKNPSPRFLLIKEKWQTIFSAFDFYQFSDVKPLGDCCDKSLVNGGITSAMSAFKIHNTPNRNISKFTFLEMQPYLIKLINFCIMYFNIFSH